MITKKETTLGELSKSLLKGTTFCAPAASRVGSIEKFQDNSQNGIGHLCNMVSFGYGGMSEVLIHGTSEDSEGRMIPGSSLKIEGRPPYLEADLYSLRRMPGDFIAKLFIAKIENYGAGNQAIRVLKGRYGNFFTLEETFGESQEVLQVEIKHFSPDAFRLNMLSRTKYPGYLVRDVLEMAKFYASTDSKVEVFIDKSVGERAVDAALKAAQYAAVPVDFAIRQLEKIGIGLPELP